MPGGQGTDFEAHCMAVTRALQARGGIWPALEAVLGDRAGKEIEPVIGGDPVWVVDQARMVPRPRRSLLDYADIVTINATDATSDLHISLDSPIESPANAGYGPTSPTSSRVKLDTKRQKALWHNVGWDVINIPRGNIVHDLLMSFYSKIALAVDEALLSSHMGEGVRTPAAGGHHFGGNGQSGITMPTGDILDAVLDMVHNSSDVAFPGDLVCVVSPAQAIGLANKGLLDTDRMDIHGIDTVVSPAVGASGHVAMVAAKRALRVAMSKVEIRFLKRRQGCSVWAEYGMGCAVDPKGEAVVMGEGAAPRRASGQPGQELRVRHARS